MLEYVAAPLMEFLYAEYNKLWESNNDKNKQQEISKRLVKKALFKFTLDWDVYIKSRSRGYADEMLRSYADLYIDISAEVHEILPQRLIDELVNLATSMKTIVNEVKTLNSKTYFIKGDECAIKALKIHETFDEYFISSEPNT